MPDPCPSSGKARPRPVADHGADLAALVHRARAGDADAWTRLVQRFDRMLRHVARAYPLAPAEVDDVLQATWLNLFESIGQIRDPNAVGGWLATATRRNALRRLQAHVREQLTDTPERGDRGDDSELDAALLALERRAALAAAIARLPSRQRALMTALLAQPALGYRQIAELLAMPRGSIGPIRARSLARLARDAQLRALSDRAADVVGAQPAPGGAGDDSSIHATRR